LPPLESGVREPKGENVVALGERHNNKSVLTIAAWLAVLALSWVSGAAPVEITFVGSWGGEYRLEVMDQLARAFESANPDIKVTILHVAGWGNSEQKAKVMIAAGTAPDLIYMGETGGVTAFAAAGLLENLDSYVRRPGSAKLDDFIPSTLHMGRFEGKLFAMPIDSITSVLYYNDDLFAKAGLIPPIVTQDELLTVARKLRTEAAPPIRQHEPWSMLRFTEYLFPNGGRYFSDDLKVNLMGSPAVRSTAEYIASAIGEGLIGVEGQGAAWSAGNAAVIEAQPIVVSNSDNQGLSFARSASKFPRGTSGKHTVYGWGHYVGIPAASRNKDAAWRFLSYLLRTDVSLIWHRDMNFLPAQFSVLRTTPYYRDHPVWRVFVDQLQDSLPLPVTPYYQDIDRIFRKEMQPALRQTASVGAAVENVVSQVDALLAGK
jgi:multiple sugar transport system substrate-binding protein